jgi:pimeloyl-[acyl-carrier protein] methyl ester esterase
MELLLLHGLPFDGSMWLAQASLLPGATHTPALYSFGDSVGAWADAALGMTRSSRLIVVGCSVGGSCALEVAVRAPERIAALVLIGTKARHAPDPAFHAAALQTIEEKGLEAAWDAYWAPLFSHSTDRAVVEAGKRMLLRRSPAEVACGVSVFHSRPSRDRFLSTFPRPVVVVTGADDVAPGPAVSRAQAEAANGRLHVVPDCGHYVPLERPAALNSVLREVIASCAP